MFAEVIPLRRFTRSRGVFDYKIPPALQKNIKIGQLVWVPFLKSQNLAVITKIKKICYQDQAKLKSIEKTASLPLLPGYLIDLAFWLAGWSAVSPATVFKMIVPPPLERTLSPATKNAAARHLAVSPAEVKIIQSLAKAIANQTKQYKKHLAIMPTAKSSLGFLIKLCQSFQTKNKSLIVVLPTIYQTDLLFQHLPSPVQQQTCLVYSGLTKSARSDNWKDIATGKKNIVLGTKLALFAPFSHLGQLVVVEEENRNHKQDDQNPRFHIRPAAEKLVELTRANLLFLSYSPSLAAWQKAANSDYQLVEFENENKKIKIVNKKDEFLKKNYSPLSEVLGDKVKKAVDQNRKVFLYLNRKGVAAALCCSCCGTIIKCRQCHQTLTLGQKDQLTCHNCLAKSNIPSKCSECQWYDWKKIGWGTKRLVSEIKRSFPGATVCRLDMDNQSIDFTAQIFVGTEKALPYLLTIKPGLIGVVSADTLLHLPDFRATERTYQLLCYLIAHLAGPAEIVIQTFSPELPLFQAVTQNKAALFYQSELKNRALLKYPPQTRIIKIFTKNKNEAKTAEQANQLATKLKTSNQGIDVLEPIATIKKEKGKFTSTILIKIPEKDVDRIFPCLVSQIPQDWHIDRDPLVLYN